MALEISQLHGTLSDRKMRSMDFLNEIMVEFPDAISFAPGAPHEAFFDEITLEPYIDAFVEHLAKQRGLPSAQARRGLYRYGPSRGIMNDLVSRLLYNDEGIEAAPETIVVTVGCQEGLFIALRALFRDASDVLAVVHPCYSGVLGAAGLLDIQLAPIDECKGRLDFDMLENTCRDARASGKSIRALYVAPDFANPSGLSLDVEDRRRLLALADTHDFLLLEDNAYGFTATQNRIPSLKALDKNQRVIHFGTFAKTCFPGARVGYLVADQPVRRSGESRLLADEMSTIKSQITVNTPGVCQAIIGGMILQNGCTLEPIVSQRRQFYAKNLAALLDSLDAQIASSGVEWNAPSGGFFVRMRLPIQVDEQLLSYCAKNFRVLWTPMSYFFVGDHASDELRLSISYLTPESISEGCRRLADFVADLRPQREGQMMAGALQP